MAGPGWFFLLLGLVALGWGLRLLGGACLRANHTDWGRPWLNYLDGCNRIYCRRLHDLGDDSLVLPEQGPAILVSNHVSGLDPLLLIAASKRPLRFVIAREQYDRPWFTWLFKAVGCIPVDRSRNPRRALRAALEQLQAGEVVALFPHGKIHLDRDPPRPLKPGAARLAELTGAPLIPARIEGVAGQGHVLPALLIPSRIQLHRLPLVETEGGTGAEILDRLELALNGVAPGDSGIAD